MKPSDSLSIWFWISIFCLFFSNGFSQQTRTSVQSGNWTNKNTWDCNCVPANTDNAIITSGHTVTFVSSNTVNNLTINSGGVISDNGLTNTITGNLVVNGTYSGTGPINLTGSNTTISGTGTISNTSTTITVTGDKTILALTTFPDNSTSATNLTISSSNIAINGAYTITNNGTITLGGNLTGSLASSTWTNNTNATFNISGTLLSIGVLNASANGNTINYFGTSAYTFKLPSLVSGYNTYYNLIISGASTKTLPNGTIAIEGDLTINATLNGNGTGKILRLRGNWNNNGAFIPGSGSVVFDGTGDQKITNTNSDEDFHNFTINKSTGDLIANCNVIIASNIGSQANKSTLNMIAGNFDLQSHTLTLGRIAPDSTTIYTGLLSWTAGRIIGSLKRYINHDWSSIRTYVVGEVVFYNGDWWKSIVNNNLNNTPVEGSNWTSHNGIIFPIGTETNNRTIIADFNNVTTGSVTGKFNEGYPGNSGLILSEDGVTVYNTFRDGYWSLTTGNSFSSTDFHLSLTGDGFSGFSINDNTRLLARNTSGDPWILNGIHQARSGNIIKRSNLSVLSGEYCFGDDTNCVAPNTSAIVGNSIVCKNDVGVTYSVTNSSGSSYAWTIDGGSIASGNGTNSINVTWGNVGIEGKVSVVESNSCTLGPLVELAVDVNSISSAISGRVNVPENGSTSVTYSLSPKTNYSYSWTVSGGTIISGQGTSSINVNWGGAGTGTVCVNASFPGCSSTQSCINVTKYKVVTSVKNGNWTSNLSSGDIWDCSCIPTSTDNIVIKNLHTVTIAVNGGRVANNVTIEAGGTLNTGGGTNRTLTVNGDLNIYGTLGGTTHSVILGNGGSSGTLYIDGTGTISNTATMVINSSRTVYNNAALTKLAGSVALSDGVVLTNYGTLSFGGDITGSNSDSKWINGSNSVLEIGAAILSTGTLDASASGNTIRYRGTTDQSIKNPLNNQYFNLDFANTGIKNLPTGTIKIGGNFSNDAIMNAGSGTVEFNGSSSIISGGITPNFNNLIISGVLTPSSLINVAGNFSNSGTFNHNSSTVQFNGIADQTILSGGAKFNNITINKSSGSLSLIDKLELISVLTFNTSTNLNSNGFLNLLSSSDSPDVTASVASMPLGANVIGNVVINRFVSDEGRFYRYISVPTKTPKVSDLQDDFAVTGNFGTKSVRDPFTNLTSICGTAIRSTSPSLYLYNETQAGIVDNGYETFPILSNNLEIGRGYAAFVRETCYRDVTIDFTGEINKGQISLPVTYTNTGDGTADGWNLVGNPYPSAISWNSPGWVKTNISNTISIRDNSGSGMMRYYDGNSGDFNGIITTGQAFWVQAIGSNPVLTIDEGVKTTATNNEFFRVRPDDVPVIRITLTENRSNGLYDFAEIKLRDDAKNELDIWDATKLKNETFGIATQTRKGLQMAINAVPEIDEGFLIPLYLDNVSANEEYTIGFNGHEEFSQFSVELIDHNLGIGKIINWGEQYSFRTGNDIEGETNRITAKLISKQSSEIKVIDLVAYPNPIKEDVTVQLPPDGFAKKLVVYDQRGLLIQQIDIQSIEQQRTINFSFKPSGVYLIQLTGYGYQVFTKLIKD